MHGPLRAGRSGDRISVGEKDFSLRPNQPSVQWVPGLFPGVKRTGRGDDNPPSSSAEVKERVELYCPSGSSRSVIGLILPYYM
jgi:hypothetical protein